ncbi:hypothetical protein H1R20_g14485, partial [Candolleomyces eurysporus]
MIYKIFLTFLLSFQLARFTSGVAAAPSPPPQNKDWPFDATEIRAPDGSITAKFVSVGATLTELWVKDKYGKARDVVLGYDDPEQLLTDPAHPYFNGIVGRYANRLKNGTFSIPISKNPTPGAPNVYQIPTNEHDGQVTLHGGIIGWDRRNWTIERKSRTSVTYKHIDAGHENWPGTVAAYATHTVENGGVLKMVVKATATEKTPIMVTQLDITSNQPAVQVYTSNWVNAVRKTHHGGPEKSYGRWSAIALEQQGYIAAVNTPEWGVDQICM